MSKEERSLKKRKVLSSSIFFFPSDVITEITKFIEKIEDYFNFSLTNKSMFNLMMKEIIISSDNRIPSKSVALNDIFKRNSITLNEEFPDYLFPLNNLNIVNQTENTQLLQRFTNLKYLTLNGCDFQDKHLQHLNTLEEIHLAECENVTGECLKKFKDLKILTLENLDVTDINDSLSKLTTLSVFGCDNYLLNLEQFPQLTSLSFSGRLGSIVLLFVAPFKNLKYLYLNIKANFDLSKGVFDFENLEELHLDIESSDNFYFDDDDLMNLPKLRTLHLLGRDNSITGSCFINLQNLQHLFISEFEEDLEEKNLKYLTNLNTLDCKGTKLSAYYLRNLTKLENLSFVPSEEFNEEYLKELTMLKTLTLRAGRYCSNFTGKYVNTLVNLTELTVPYSDVEDKYLTNLIKLKSLDVSNCEEITGECLLNLNNLQRLNINGINIHGRYLKHLKNLTHLCAKNCNKIIIDLIKENNLLQEEIQHDNTIEEKEKEIKQLKLLIDKYKKTE